MIEFNDGSYGLILEYDGYQSPKAAVHFGSRRPGSHYGQPWRVRLPNGNDKWCSANSFRRKI